MGQFDAVCPLLLHVSHLKQPAADDNRERMPAGLAWKPGHLRAALLRVTHPTALATINLFAADGAHHAQSARRLERHDVHGGVGRAVHAGKVQHTLFLGSTSAPVAYTFSLASDISWKAQPLNGAALVWKGEFRDKIRDGGCNL